MNGDTLEGTMTDIGGQAKQAVGNATGDSSLQAQGAADQLTGALQKASARRATPPTR